MLENICFFALCLFPLLTSPIICRDASSNPPCSRTFTGANDTIESPRNPRVYGAQSFCNYAVTVSSMKQISLKFQQVQLFRQINTLVEYVVVFDGPDCVSPRIGVIHGNQTQTIISSSNTLTALLVAYWSSDTEKFKATYSTVSGQNKTESVPPDKNNRILDNCGNELGGRSGNFSYRGDRSKNALCIWRIKVADARTVRVRFTKVNLGPDGAWLRVLNGDNCGAPVMQLISESLTEPYSEFNSTSNAMLVVYASSISSETAQIEASYWEEMTSPTRTKETTAPYSERDDGGTRVPSLPKDSVTHAEEMANNPAVSKKFSLIDNSVGYAMAGVLLLLFLTLA